MEQEKGADPVRDLLERLVGIVKDGQESNRKLLANHSEAISANRDALEGLAELVNAQTRAFNVLREVVLHLWQKDYPEAPFPSTTTVN